MPVRTAKHRASRHLWTWPLRSPLHLVAAAAVPAALLTLLALLPAAPAPTPTEPPAPAESAAPPTSSTPPPSTTPPPPNPAPPAALGVARDFITAWTHHPPGMTPRGFHKRLRAFAHPEFLATTLRDVDPARIPDTRVTGPPRAITVTDHRVTLTIPTDTATHHLTLTRTTADPDAWRVHHRRVVTHP